MSDSMIGMEVFSQCHDQGEIKIAHVYVLYIIIIYV